MILLQYTKKSPFENNTVQQASGINSFENLLFHTQNFQYLAILNWKLFYISNYFTFSLNIYEENIIKRINQALQSFSSLKVSENLIYSILSDKFLVNFLQSQKSFVITKKKNFVSLLYTSRAAAI